MCRHLDHLKPFPRSLKMVLVETMFSRYREKHLETRLQGKHVNFKMKNSCFKFFIVVILLHSEPLPGQVSQHLVPKPRINNSKVFYLRKSVCQ